MQWVKDLVLPQLWYRPRLWRGFYLWPGNFHMPQLQPKKRKQKKIELMKNKMQDTMVIKGLENADLRKKTK